MSRPTRRWRYVLLLGTLLALSGCVGADSGPRPVSLADLVSEQDEYDGERVVAEGVVHTYPSPRHYWIEDAEVNRVELVPPRVAAAHVGDRVRVEGRFTFRDDEGRRIEVEDLEVLDDAQSAIERDGHG